MLSILNLEDAPPYREQEVSAGAGHRALRGHQPCSSGGGSATIDFDSDSGGWSPQYALVNSLVSSGVSNSPQSSSSSSRSSRHGQGSLRRDVCTTGGQAVLSNHVSTAVFSPGRAYAIHNSSHQAFNARGTQEPSVCGPSGLSTPPTTPPSSMPARLYAGIQEPLQDLERQSNQSRRHRRTVPSNPTPEPPRRLPGVREICKQTISLTSRRSLRQLQAEKLKLMLDLVNQPTYPPARVNPKVSQARDAYRDSRNQNATFTSINRRPPMSSDPQQDEVNSLCRARTDCWVPDCKLDSPDRRVVSHFFGRNKKETRAIPEDCWVPYCRQHYQRSRYQLKTPEFADLQMSLVRRTVKNLELWGNVLHWTITIRKRMLDQIAQEDALRAAAKTHLIEKPCQERALLPFCGDTKSFADVYALINAVRDYAWQNDCEAMEFEIVPQFRAGFVEKRTGQRRAMKMPIHSKATQPSNSCSLKKSVKGTPAMGMSSKASSKK